VEWNSEMKLVTAGTDRTYRIERGCVQLVTAGTDIVLSMAVKNKIILLVICTLRTAAPFVHEVGADNKWHVTLSK
jgi:hypothetical protein